LREAVRRELPFAPPFQLKALLNPLPQPEHFESDVDYLGDWNDESLLPFYEIEWLRVRPRFLQPRGRLVAPEFQSVEAAFMEVLRHYRIPHRCDSDTIWICGYASTTHNIVTNS
jgi:hypothetical protein